MKNVSIKKLSILGLVLMTASVVTAAIMPKKSTAANKFDRAGNLINSTDAGGSPKLTCGPLAGTANCISSADSGTTGNPANGGSSDLNNSNSTQE